MKMYIIKFLTFSVLLSIFLPFLFCGCGTEKPLEERRDEIKQFDTSKPLKTEAPETEADVTDPENETSDETNSTEAVTSDETSFVETEAPEYEPTLDFTLLHEKNPDIQAWIEIDGTNIDYPILQNPDNDLEYLRKAYDGTKYNGGEFFTQATYNAFDFNDPVTVIYGHAMRSGDMLGQLQKTYSYEDGFKSHRDIKIYLPDGVRHYTVFAAVPFDKTHILHTYDFENEYWYGNFFKKIKKIRELEAVISEEDFPEYGDRVIILSTCLSGDKTRRYLVMAVYSEDLADNKG